MQKRKATIKQPRQQAKPFRLKLTSDKRRTAGFHIFPEYEIIIDNLAALNPALRGRKGEALEFIISRYLADLPDEQRKRLINYQSLELEGEEW